MQLSPFSVVVLELRRYFGWLNIVSSLLTGFHMNFTISPVPYQKKNAVTSFIDG